MSMVPQRPALLVCLLTVLVRPVLAQPGELDPSFGLNGLGAIGMALPAEAAEAIAFQSDGSIILAGHTEAATDTTAWVARLLPTTGFPDFTFGQGGVLAVDIGQGPERAFDVIVDAQDRILVTGFAFTDSLPHLFVRRLLPNGDVDTSFSSSGTHVDPTPLPSVAYSLVATAEGGAIAAGALNDGAFWTRFDSTGLATGLGFDLGWSGHGAQVVRDLAGSGDTVLFGVGDGSLADRDILINGRSFDLTTYGPFGTNGQVQLDLGEDEEGHAVAVDGQGRVLVAGHVGSNFKYDLLVARFLPDGTLDGSFGTNGIVREDIGQAYFLGKDLQVLDDGRILVLVNTATAGPTPIDLLMFQDDGTRDITFGTGGLAVISLFPVYGNGRALVVQDSCRALVAGVWGYPSDQDALIAALQLDCGMISTSLSQDPDSGFQLYPNPTAGEVHIRLDDVAGQGPCSWQILDLAGRVVMSGRLSGGHTEIQADIAPGTYAVWIRDGEDDRTHLLQVVR